MKRGHVCWSREVESGSSSRVVETRDGKGGSIVKVDSTSSNPVVGVWSILFEEIESQRDSQKKRI